MDSLGSRPSLREAGPMPGDSWAVNAVRSGAKPLAAVDRRGESAVRFRGQDDRLVRASKAGSGRPSSSAPVMRAPRGRRSRSGSLRGAVRHVDRRVDRALRRPDRVREGPEARRRPRAPRSACPVRAMPAGSSVPAPARSAAPEESSVSCTSSSRSVPRKVALLAPFGGRYIARWYSPRMGANEAASPATNVPGVIAAASWP